jgi:glucose dehydrogenase
MRVGVRKVVFAGLFIATGSAMLAGCTGRSAVGGGRDTTFVQGARIATAPPNNNAGEWLYPGRDYASSRYSPLAQITPANAKNLKVSWTFSTGVLRGHEGQPLVVGKTMYIITPYPNVAYALDLTKPGFPLKWKYRPENAQAAVGIACCDVVNRGASFSDGKLVYNLLDGHTVAVDAETGTELWKTKMGDINRGETITMAPIIVKGKVIVGSSGGEMGVRGWIAAVDLATGKQLWRGNNIGPDTVKKVGGRF